MTGYNPALYALVHCGNPGDRAFYGQIASGVGSVLELGCGYGRLLPVLAQGSARYVGLDFEPGLLSMAKDVRKSLPAEQRARVTLRGDDMRTFALRTRFDRIVIPHSGLYCLPSARAVLQCLRRVREQLSDDGELVLDAYNADDFHGELAESAMTGKERDWVSQVTADGVRYEVFERTRWHKPKQQLAVTYEYESASRVRHRGRIRHHYLLRAQLEELLARAGLAPTQIAGSFAGTRWTRRSEHLVVRARRA
jgi:SAM-dependent methyltransferase